MGVICSARRARPVGGSGRNSEIRVLMQQFAKILETELRPVIDEPTGGLLCGGIVGT